MLDGKIRVSIEAPADIIVKIGTRVTHVSVTYSVICFGDVLNEGTPNEYTSMGATLAITEMKGGLAYFDGYESCWKLLENEVQEAYANYIAEKEILEAKVDNHE